MHRGCTGHCTKCAYEVPFFFVVNSNITNSIQKAKNKWLTASRLVSASSCFWYTSLRSVIIAMRLKWISPSLYLKQDKTTRRWPHPSVSQLHIVSVRTCSADTTIPHKRTEPRSIFLPHKNFDRTGSLVLKPFNFQRVANKRKNEANEMCVLNWSRTSYTPFVQLVSSSGYEKFNIFFHTSKRKLKIDLTTTLVTVIRREIFTGRYRSQ